ncbi:Large ribosomal RNA subunit accumulation protein YceD [Bartonella apihabitans]|uniref:YceD family protein n=1 Tax=Bartonella apihabitans TaxID=2750929 RepID=UPI003997EAF3
MDDNDQTHNNDNDHHVMSFAIHYPVNVRSLPVKGIRIKIDADEKERLKLVENHGLLEVKSFHADVHISPWKKRGVRVKGKFEAEIVQACVVTLEPLPKHIEEEVESVFIPDDSKLVKYQERDNTSEVFVDAEGPDTPEVFHGDSIDIGAFLEEFFELSIDPYPRKEGVDGNYIEDMEKDKTKPSPFAILKQLK